MRPGGINAGSPSGRDLPNVSHLRHLALDLAHNLDCEYEFGSMDAQKLIHEYGDWFYVITFFWTFLEGETFVLFAGILAGDGLLSPWLLFGSAWLGSFCGDQVYFATGRRYGEALLNRFPSWRGNVDRTLGFLRRFNSWFILTFRFIYGIRNFAAFTMGMSGLSWSRFIPLNFIAAGVWASVFVGLGYGFGEALRAVLGNIVHTFGYIMLGMFVLVCGGFSLMHYLQRRKAKSFIGAQKSGVVP